MKTIKISKILTRIKQVVTIEDDVRYKRVTIKTNNKGIILRDIALGNEIGTKNQFIIKANQFLLSKIDARNGAFGIVPMELDNAIITGNFWTFEVNSDLLDIEWFNIFSSLPSFIDICDKASSGTTNRRYLDEQKFLNFQIALPNLEEQKQIVKQFNEKKEKYVLLTKIIHQEEDIICQLRQSILQEAIQGKLIEQDPNDEPASILLEKIQEERERLIREKKIKKEKPLPPITKDEIPFELPRGWEWTRVGSITKKIGSGSTPTGGKTVYTKSGIKFIRSQNVWNNGLKIDDIAFIPEKINQKMKNTIVESNDLLLNITGASIGRCCILDDNFDIANVSQHVSIIRLIDVRLKEFIHSSLISPYFQQLIQDVQVGISREGLSAVKLSHMLIPIPPIREQERIIAKLKGLMQFCNELEQSIEQSKLYSEMLMKAVLQEAFNLEI